MSTYLFMTATINFAIQLNWQNFAPNKYLQALSDSLTHIPLPPFV